MKQVVVAYVVLAHGVWGVALVYAPISGWVGYWTYRRFADLRRTSR